MKLLTITTILISTVVSYTNAFSNVDIINQNYQQRTSLQLQAEPLEGGSTIRVCTGPTCGKRGGKKTLPIFQELAEDIGITVESFSCVSDCAECGLGPNVEIRKAGDDGPFYPIKNNVKTEDDVKIVLGLN